MWSAFELWSECWHALRGSWPYCTIYLVQCCTPGPWSTSTWCSAFDGGYQRRQKANGQLEKTAGPPSQRLALQCPGGFRRCTAIYAVEIWDRQVSRSGATVHLDYATTMMIIMSKFTDIWEVQEATIRFMCDRRSYRGEHTHGTWIPSRYQVMFGWGMPSAWHSSTAESPLLTSTVRRGT